MVIVQDCTKMHGQQNIKKVISASQINRSSPEGAPFCCVRITYTNLPFKAVYLEGFEKMETRKNYVRF
jgi:hypothetical protein